jgi:hypothetical protein
MGGFATGLIGSLGNQVQAKNERDINARHQASQAMAQQYYKMGDDATKAGDPDLAAEYYKAGFGLHTTPPDKKPSADQMNPHLIMENFLKNGGQVNKGAQQQQPGVIAPNGVTPGTGDFSSQMSQMAGQKPLQPGMGQTSLGGLMGQMQGLKPPPSPNIGGGGNSDDPGGLF